jgi:hypothetical protein
MCYVLYYNSCAPRTAAYVIYVWFPVSTMSLGDHTKAYTGLPVTVFIKSRGKVGHARTDGICWFV